VEPVRESKTRYRMIRDEIRSEIVSNTYGPGDRLPSDMELANRFEVSRLTVIRALRDLVKEGLVQRRAGSGTFVASAPLSTRTFGILMPDLGDGEVFEPVSQGIARAGESAHQTMLWGDMSASGPSKESHALELCRYFISRKVAGVFFAPVELTPNQDEVNEHIAFDLEHAGIPVVLIDRCYRRYPERSAHDLVGIDNRRCGYRMTQHLMRAGARRVAFVYRPGSAQTVAARHAGFREALWHAGLAAEDYLSFATDGTNSAEVSKFMNEQAPDAMVCANDLTAAKMMHDLMRLGVRIPEDVRMAGINDVKYASFLPVPLTTLRQPCQQIGFAAMNAMVERLNAPDMPARDISLDCELIVRQSCGTSGGTQQSD
jgi:GntR family transcriptional regulator, arabinose operon transcriptional repressor